MTPLPNLPIEVIERILFHCDGKTLNVAKKVHPIWHDIVDYHTRTTDIWKRCCVNDIPENELVNYCAKYKHKENDEDMWLNIYDSWVAWEDIGKNIVFETLLCPVDVPRITCVAVSGPFIAVGSEDGRVKIFSEYWTLLHTARYQAVKITELTFMNDEDDIHHNGKVILLLAYKTGTLVLTEFDGRLNEVTMITDVKLHSVYKYYLCYEKRGGRVILSKLCRGPNGSKVFAEITYLRIYSPNEVSCLHIWGGVATFLIQNEVKILKYDRNIPPISRLESKVEIKFCLNTYPRLDWSCHIYRDDIIICACVLATNEKLKDQFLELFILGSKDVYSKKMFNSYEILHANITCMFLYGNIFVLGDDSGQIYFYHISSWKTFDIRNYQKKIIVGQHPIIGIDVKEVKDERRFFVTSNFNIHEVIGFTPFSLI